MATIATIKQPYQSTWTRTNLWIAQVFLWLLLFFLPFSHFLVNQAATLATIFVLISGNFYEKWLRLKQYKCIPWIILFIVIVGISITYSTATTSKAFSFFNKYTKLLYILPFLFICQSEKRRQMSLNVLLCSVTFVAIVALLDYIGILHLASIIHLPKIFPFIKESGTFVNLIPLSILEAFSIYLLLGRIIRKESSALSISLLAFIVVSLFYINTERTGCLAAIVLAYLAIFQNMPSKKTRIFIAILVTTLLGTALIFTSRTMLEKFFSGFHEIKHYSTVISSTDNQPMQKVSKQLGSIGLRMAFAKGSFDIIKQHPWFGAGVGSFAKEYNSVDGVLLPGTTELWDPHNAFLMLGVQVGFIGLAIFVIFLLALLRDISRLPFLERRIGYGLGILFVLNSFFNATLIDNTVGFLYVTIASVLLSSLLYVKTNSNSPKS